MTTTVEDLAIDAASSLLDQDREKVRTAYERDEAEAEGSIVIALMVIAIMVNVARLVMDHCIDKDSFIARAGKPRYIDNRTVNRRVRQMYRQMKISPKDLGGLEAKVIAHEMLTRGAALDASMLGNVWNERLDA